MQQQRSMRALETTAIVSPPPSLPLSEGIVLVSMILVVLASPFLYDLAVAMGVAR
jgi:hypothetical protein